VADLTVQVIALTGLKATYAGCTEAGDAVVNDGRIFLHFVNGATEAIVTVDSVRPCDQGSDHDVVVTVPANEEKMIGPFNKDRFNDANAKLQITYSNVTTITVAAIRLPL